MDERPDTGRDALPGDLETVRPAALGLTTLSHTLSYNHDLAPFVQLAFPQSLARHTVLTPAQRTFRSALLASQRQPFDGTLCRTLLGS